MRKGIILTLPRYDTVTEYLSAFSHDIKEESCKKGILLKTLEGKNANREEFEKVMKKLNYNMVVFNGHGTKESIAGDKDNTLVKVKENEEILYGKIVYARSCEAASILGEACTNDSDGCFIGYFLPFEFYFNPEWMGNPLKDNTAKLFLESSNLAPISIIKGNTAEEANRKSKNQMLKNIKKVLRSKTQESFLIAESLWNNYVGQGLIGNKEAIL